jgi:pimeloyl-ACP methyl ester carboxylesterase
LHALVMGEASGRPPVVFEGSLAAPLQTWAPLQRELAGETVAISYERAGTGWSEAGPRPRGAGRLAGELDALLAGLGAGNPVVLVGHWFGALVACEYLRHHPDRVAGLVFLDPLHPAEYRRSARLRRSMAWLRQSLQLSTLHCAVGMSRRQIERQFVELPGDLAEQARARIGQPRVWWTAWAELRAWQYADPERLALPSVPAGLPVAVVASGDSLRSDTTHRRLMEELVGSSGNSFFIPVREATHADLLYEPAARALVSEAIRKVLAGGG